MDDFNFKPGDLVQVKDPDGYLSPYANKLRNRDGVIEWVGPTANDMWPRHARVRFLKRGTRGKEFQMTMLKSDLMASPNQPKEPA